MDLIGSNTATHAGGSAMADDDAQPSPRAASGPAPMRRLLFTLVELGPGGIETNVLNLLQGLDRKRYAMSLFLHHGPRQDGSLGRHVPPHVQVAWALKGAYRRWKLPFMLAKLLPAARECDVIVAGQEGRATLLSCIAGLLLRKPVIGCIQFDWMETARHMRRRQVVGLQWLCPRMSRIVACGQDSAKSLRQIVKLDPQRLTVIPNFVEAGRVLAQANDPLPAWAEPIFKKPVVVAMGRLNEQKGFDVLVKAHAMLRSYVDHHLLILGEGHLRSELLALAASLNVSDSLFLPGFCERPFAVLRHGSVFAMSSRFEGLPFALIEAMTLGLPVVSTDCPSGPREVLEDGRYGELVPVENAAALADALARVLADAPRRGELSQRSRNRAALYADTHAIPAWHQVLDDVFASI